MGCCVVAGGGVTAGVPGAGWAAGGLAAGAELGACAMAGASGSETTAEINNMDLRCAFISRTKPFNFQDIPIRYPIHTRDERRSPVTPTPQLSAK